MKTKRMVWWAIGAAGFAAGILPAQVPPDIATKLIAIGRGVCVPETAELYAPLQPKPPYAGVTFTRDVSIRTRRQERPGCGRAGERQRIPARADLSFGRGRQ